jgi:hypothetical protein
MAKNKLFARFKSEKKRDKQKGPKGFEKTEDNVIAQKEVTIAETPEDGTQIVPPTTPRGIKVPPSPAPDDEIRQHKSPRNPKTFPKNKLRSTIEEEEVYEEKMALRRSLSLSSPNPRINGSPSNSPTKNMPEDTRKLRRVTSSEFVPETPTFLKSQRSSPNSIVKSLLREKSGSEGGGSTKKAIENTMPDIPPFSIALEYLNGRPTKDESYRIPKRLTSSPRGAVSGDDLTPRPIVDGKPTTQFSPHLDRNSEGSRSQSNEQTSPTVPPRVSSRRSNSPRVIQRGENPNSNEVGITKHSQKGGERADVMPSEENAKKEVTPRSTNNFDFLQKILQQQETESIIEGKGEPFEGWGKFVERRGGVEGIPPKEKAENSLVKKEMEDICQTILGI